MHNVAQKKPTPDSISCVFLSENGERTVFRTDSSIITDETTELFIRADSEFYSQLSRYLGEVGSIEDIAEKLRGITNDVHLSAISEAVYPNIVTTLTKDEFKSILAALRLYCSHQR